MDVKERRQIKNQLLKLIDCMNLYGRLQQSDYMDEQTRELLSKLREGSHLIYQSLEANATAKGYKPLPPQV